MDIPETHYATTEDGLSLAWQQFGEGPIDVVIVPGVASHVELVWEMPAGAYSRRRMASFARCLVFDKRGSGLSDRQTGTPDDRMHDIAAVMDAAGVERAVVEATSESGPLAIRFAAAYPERVERLVLVCTFARIWDKERTLQFADWLERHWGKGAAGEFGWFGDDHSDESRAAMARIERQMSTPRNVAKLTLQNLDLDCRDILESIEVPTLVVHRSGDPMVPPAWGRELVEGIPGAEWVELPGDFHMPITTGQVDEQIDVVEAWLTGASSGRGGADRVLATVLFADIVGSTEAVRAAGDEKWSALIAAFDDAARRAVERHGGRWVKSTGDGLLATFDAPTRAVGAARALRTDGGQLGLTLRQGLHVGEVEVRAEDLAGVAVHVASRVADAAADGEIWVSPSVPDLTAGSGITFEARGAHDLKGLDDPLALSAVAG